MVIDLFDNDQPSSSQKTLLCMRVHRDWPLIHPTSNMKTLAVRGAGWEDVGALHACIGDEALSLTKLTIVNPEEDSLSHFSGLVSCLPALGYLQLAADAPTDMTCNIDLLLSALTWPRRNTTDNQKRGICPHLGSLWLSRCAMSRKSPRGMIASRLPVEEDEAMGHLASHLHPPPQLLTWKQIDDPTSYTDVEEPPRQDIS